MLDQQLALETSNTFRGLLDEYKISYVASGARTRPGWLNLKCVRCEKDPYLGFNIAGSYCSCWACGYIPLWEVIHSLTRLPVPECHKLANSYPKHIYLDAKRETPNKLQLPNGIEVMSWAHYLYLHKRGFSPELIERQWDVGGLNHKAGKLAWRLFIPVHLRGEVVSWTTRAIGNKEPRYLSASDEQSTIPIDELVYGIDHCRMTVIVVEGPVDAWAIGPGACSLLGQNATPARLAQLAAYPLRVICFDSEPQAQARARKLANDLSIFDGVTKIINLETGKDPASANKSELQAIRKEFLQ